MMMKIHVLLTQPHPHLPPPQYHFTCTLLENINRHCVYAAVATFEVTGDLALKRTKCFSNNKVGRGEGGGGGGGGGVYGTGERSVSESIKVDCFYKMPSAIPKSQGTTKLMQTL